MQKHGQGSYQFDIRETLRLSHEQIPIEEIDDLELVQKIECNELGDNIEISGHLILVGNYKGKKDVEKLKPTDQLPDSFEESVLFEPLTTETESFSPFMKKGQIHYQIPVQITLPREKVTDIDGIYTYVSSFDYEVKTPYQMDIMASLIIGGLIDRDDSFEAKESKRDQFEFVYTAGGADQDSTEARLGSFQMPEEQAIEKDFQLNARDDSNWGGQDDERESTVEESNVAPSNETVASSAPSEDKARQEAESESNLDESGEVARDEEKDMGRTEDESFEVANEEQQTKSNVIPIPHLTDSIEQRDETENEQGARVAITNKSKKEEEEAIPSLSRLFASKGRPTLAPDDDATLEEEEAERAEEVDATDAEEEKDAAYLGNFLKDDTEQFTKLKICIIQKDETIDDIAERYELTVDAILRTNGASRAQVAPGQLLYIPVKG